MRENYIPTPLGHPPRRQTREELEAEWNERDRKQALSRRLDIWHGGRWGDSAPDVFGHWQALVENGMFGRVAGVAEERSEDS